MTAEAGKAAGAARAPVWKRESAAAWNAIATAWPTGRGGNVGVDVRRQALLGIFSFLGIEMDERDMERVKRAGGEAIGDAMAKMERLLW
jgi:hypothetical protein